jgi:hypothetical protein
MVTISPLTECQLYMSFYVCSIFHEVDNRNVIENSCDICSLQINIGIS